jgi:O-antigen ligase
MYFVYSLTLVIIIVHLFNYLNGKAPLFRKSFLDIPLILFIVSQIVSTIFSINPHTSIFGYYSRLNGGLLSLISYALLYWILIVYINDKLKEKIINYSLLSGLIVATYGILQHFGIDKNFWQQDVMARVFSTFGQPNWLAAYLCILLPLSLHHLLNSKTKKFFFTFYFLLFTFYICLLYTKSKSGIIAAIISLSIFSLIYLYKNKFKIPIHFYFLLFTFVFTSLLINNPIKDNLLPQKQTEIQDLRSDILITPSEDIRTIVWQGAIDIWREFPIFGTGPETFADAYYWTRPAAHNLTSEWNFLYNKAHNEYLNYLATTGTFGFITYMVLILFILYHLRRTIYLIPFLSILITNFAGFSIVIVSLYFFLLPALTLPELPPSKNNSQSKLFFVFCVLCFMFLSYKNLTYYLADISYAQSESYDRQQKYEDALKSIQISLNYRPDEPVYLISQGTLSAKLALTTQDEKYINPTLISLEKATQISPFNLNLWKEKAQAYYYLSALDNDYYLLAIDALTKATKIAPTDAMSFYLLAEFYDRINQTDSATKNYQAAIDLKPNYDHALFALGKIHFNKKEYQLAKTLFEKTILIAPTNLEAKDYLSQIATISSQPQ